MSQKIYYDSPIGRICLVEEENQIAGLFFEQGINENKETPLLIEAKRQLQEYFAGVRTEFNLPIKFEGTEFQIKVWKALQTIPYGEIRSYGEIAKQIGNSNAARAVGNANNKNHIMILIPCHRVVGADGSLVGFGAGLPVKEYLLKLEREKNK